MIGILGFAKNVHTLAKPTIAFLGSYSAGKTYLINQLINEKVFSSNLAPTTAVITVIRHIEDRPDSWSSDHNVFTLKKGTSIRTLDPEAVTGCYTLDELEQLTTYADDNPDHDAVVVFLEKDILKQCTFLDSPGIGILSEADKRPNPEREIKLGSKEKAAYLEREHALQQMVIADADAYLLLSPVVGTCGLFADDNTGTILNHIAGMGRQLSQQMPLQNLIFVGTQADPNREGSDDEDELIRKMHVQIAKQVKNLPLDLRAKFDVNLTARIQLFYTLDSKQIQVEIQKIAKTLRYTLQSAPAEKIQAEAEKQFFERQGEYERRKGFDPAFASMAEQLQLFWYQTLSNRYACEQATRKQAWEVLGNMLESDIHAAERNCIDHISNFYNHLVDPLVLGEIIDEILDDRGNMEAAPFISGILADSIDDELRQVLWSQQEGVARTMKFELDGFNERFIVNGFSIVDFVETEIYLHAAKLALPGMTIFPVHRPQLQAMLTVFMRRLFGFDTFLIFLPILLAWGWVIACLASVFYAGLKFSSEDAVEFLRSRAFYENLKILKWRSDLIRVLHLILIFIVSWAWIQVAFNIVNTYQITYKGIINWIVNSFLLSMVVVLGLVAWLFGVITSVTYARTKVKNWRRELILQFYQSLQKNRHSFISSASSQIQRTLTQTSASLLQSFETTKRRATEHIHEVHRRGEDGSLPHQSSVGSYTIIDQMATTYQVTF